MKPFSPLLLSNLTETPRGFAVLALILVGITLVIVIWVCVRASYNKTRGETLASGTAHLASLIGHHKRHLDDIENRLLGFETHLDESLGMESVAATPEMKIRISQFMNDLLAEKIRHQVEINAVAEHEQRYRSRFPSGGSGYGDYLE